jgi:hypothetical protein
MTKWVMGMALVILAAAPALAQDRAAHGQQTRLKNVEPVDLFHAGLADRPMQSVEPNLLGELVPLSGGQGFRIAQSRNGARRVEDHGSGQHRACERAPTRLIDAADPFIRR